MQALLEFIVKNKIKTLGEYKVYKNKISAHNYNDATECYYIYVDSFDDFDKNLKDKMPDKSYKQIKNFLTTGLPLDGKHVALFTPFSLSKKYNDVSWDYVDFKKLKSNYVYVGMLDSLDSFNSSIFSDENLLFTHIS